MSCAQRESGVRPSQPAPAMLPSFVRIAIDDAVVGPGKVNGEPWDGIGRLPPQVFSDLNAALSAYDPRMAVASTLGSLVSYGFKPPEPFGWVDLEVHGQAVGRYPLQGRGQRDTFTPTWDGPPTWHRVPLTPATHLRGQIFDRDFQFHDPIGTFVINYDHLIVALQARKVYPVRVAEQTSRQILFVGIEVWPE